MNKWYDKVIFLVCSFPVVNMYKNPQKSGRFSNVP